MEAISSVIQKFSRLPGIGKKSAARIAYWLLRADPQFIEGLATEIVELQSRVKSCGKCGAFTSSEFCPICTDPNRDREMLCIVEQPQDVEVLETSREYSGLYHVLDGVLAPLDGVGPEDLNIASLLPRIQTEGVKELIIATNPTLEGDTTALYLKKLVEGLPVKVSRLALGIPVGGDLEYTDRLTLARSLRGRTAL